MQFPKSASAFALLIAFGAGSLAANAAEPVSAKMGPGSYGQHLVEVALAAHPEAAALTLYATPPKATAAVIVASTAGRVGEPAGAEAQRAIAGGETALVLDASSGRRDVVEPLLDASGATIGAIDLAFRAAAKSDAARERAAAASVQTYLRRHVLSTANLADPFPYSAQYSPNNAAQALVDATMARHPELLVLGMHVTLPDGRGNVMLGTNIGRIGKLADDDDMRVVTTGAANHEISDDGRRYEVELVLENAAKQNIGALGVVFRYQPGDDKDALNARADAVRDEMARAIPSAASLLAARAPLTLAGTTALPGYKGDFDHFDVDLAAGRLYLAGEDGAALEVFDLHSGALVRSQRGYGVPHSPFVLAQAREVVVVDGTKPSPVLDAVTLARKRALRLPAGADSAAYDASTGHLWVVTGGKDVPQRDSNLIEIDPRSGSVLHRVHFDASHVEALAIEQHGDALFINVTDKNMMAVIDKRTGAIRHWWRIREAQQNAPVAFDEAHHRLFVVTRKPGKLVVLNADSGATVASFNAPARADQVVWDDANKRVYVTGGEGTIGVFQQNGADAYEELARVPSAPGAKTAILIPSLNRLYVAASPGDTRVGGAVLRYDVTPR